MSRTTEIDRKLVEVVKKVKEEVINVRWAFKNFTKAYSSARGNVLESGGFDIEGNSFSLMLRCPQFDDGDFLLEVWQDLRRGGPVDIKCDAWLEDLDGNKHWQVRLDQTHEEYRFHKFEESLRKQDLETSIKLRNDVAIFCCEVRQKLPGELFVPPTLDLELRQKLWHSYQQGLTSDIIIQAEGKELQVSKAILAANSDVFERMLLTSNCKEAQDGIIKIKEASYEVMKAFVEYLHMGQLDNLPEICDDLFALAHKYLVVPLQKDCSKEMINSLGKENVVDRLKLAFLYNEQDLKEAALKYITSKESDMNFCQILMSTQWHSFLSKNMSLAQEITIAVFAKMQSFSKQDDDDEIPSKRRKLN